MGALSRFVEGMGLAAGLVAGAVALPFILAANRSTYADETGSCASCLLNALTGGPRRATFSAWSWELRLRGKRGAALRVRAVDGFGLRPGHCRDAYDYHVQQGLIRPASIDGTA
ncbi:hypothetical protein VQH23_21150 [Pararoseomonas sp. SCSIO 73927]|uniref:hypothetical protein n=1 Tax=Pararoseomonas sp. SCSIO 73927 TaxID=3114537 RepID=UPI0030CEBC29